MPEYVVTLRWTIGRLYTVEADTPDAAHAAALDQWAEDTHPYSDDNYNGHVPAFIDDDEGDPSLPTWRPDTTVVTVSERRNTNA